MVQGANYEWGLNGPYPGNKPFTDQTESAGHRDVHQQKPNAGAVHFWMIRAVADRDPH